MRIARPVSMVVPQGKFRVPASSTHACAPQVGLLDIDICGPSVPKLTGLEAEEIHKSALGWSPVYVEDNLAVMSIGFLLPNPDDAVIWRGPRKNGLIKQFLKVRCLPVGFIDMQLPPASACMHCLRWLGVVILLSGAQSCAPPCARSYRMHHLWVREEGLHAQLQLLLQRGEANLVRRMCIGASWTTWSWTRRRGRPTSTSRSRSS